MNTELQAKLNEVASAADLYDEGDGSWSVGDMGMIIITVHLFRPTFQVSGRGRVQEFADVNDAINFATGK